MKLLSFAICTLLALNTSALLAETEDPPPAAESFGSLYLAQEEKPTAYHLQFGPHYGYDYSDPYYSNHVFGLSARIQPFRYLGADLGGEFYINQDKSLAKDLYNQLDMQGLQASIHKAKAASFIDVALIPIRGAVNIFSMAISDFALSLGAGNVQTIYEDIGLRMGFYLFARQDLFLTEHWGMDLELRHTIDWPNGGAAQGRTQLRVGANYKL